MLNTFIYYYYYLKNRFFNFNFFSPILQDIEVYLSKKVSGTVMIQFLHHYTNIVIFVFTKNIAKTFILHTFLLLDINHFSILEILENYLEKV